MPGIYYSKLIGKFPLAENLTIGKYSMSLYHIHIPWHYLIFWKIFLTLGAVSNSPWPECQFIFSATEDSAHTSGRSLGKYISIRWCWLHFFFLWLGMVYISLMFILGDICPNTKIQIRSTKSSTLVSIWHFKVTLFLLLWTVWEVCLLNSGFHIHLLQFFQTLL